MARKFILDVLGNPVMTGNRVVVIDAKDSKGKPFYWDCLRIAKVTKLNERSINAVILDTNEEVTYRMGRFVKLYKKRRPKEGNNASC